MYLDFMLKFLLYLTVCNYIPAGLYDLNYSYGWEENLDS